MIHVFVTFAGFAVEVFLYARSNRIPADSKEMPATAKPMTPVITGKAFPAFFINPPVLSNSGSQNAQHRREAALQG